jgi:serine/threonine protein kinase/tetratricopeptide (TPR) repeat protein
MVGQTLSHYRVLEKLGGGGMGVVYLAEDQSLGRKVALKLLPAGAAPTGDARERLFREARAASALNHPHICTIHEVSEADSRPFIAMEWLEGQTLKQRLERPHAGGPAMAAEEILRVAEHIADALDAAHAAGIVHRDLKPANLFITKRGDAKILDFGLATIDHGAGTDLAETAFASDPGTTVGTVGYMSPEQARGETVDGRSDLFSFGVVLYEMAAGRRPFGGATAAVIFEAILNRRPESVRQLAPHIQPALAELITGLMAKDRAARPQSARQVLEELRAIRTSGERRDSGGAMKTMPSVAVLPFANMSADPGNDFFSDGLAEELINALAQLPGLRVASRTSAFRFRGQTADVREIGHQLNVETIVEGSVRRADKRLRITAQLINVADGYHLWSDRYDREMADIFDIQDEITASIVKMLKPALLGGRQSLVPRHTVSVDAYELYLRGRHLCDLRSPQALLASAKYFEQAIAIDPEYALAHAGLADAYVTAMAYSVLDRQAYAPRAEQSATRALALDPDLAEAHFAMALYTYYCTSEWIDADRHWQRAIELQPHLAMAHGYYAVFLAVCHRFADAATAITRANDTDPLSPFVQSLTAMASYASRRYLEARRLAERALELHPGFPLAMWLLAISCSRLGDHAHAIELFEQLVSTTRRSPVFLGLLGFVYARAGRIDQAEAVVAELEQLEGEASAPSFMTMMALGARPAAILARLRTYGVAPAVETIFGEELDALAADPTIAEWLERSHLMPRPVNRA